MHTGMSQAHLAMAIISLRTPEEVHWRIAMGTNKALEERQDCLEVARYTVHTQGR